MSICPDWAVHRKWIMWPHFLNRHVGRSWFNNGVAFVEGFFPPPPRNLTQSSATAVVFPRRALHPSQLPCALPPPCSRSILASKNFKFRRTVWKFPPERPPALRNCLPADRAGYMLYSCPIALPHLVLTKCSLCPPYYSQLSLIPRAFRDV
jgi:hypothetical protein